MSTQIQRRRGTTAQHASFTGAVGETTIDTDKEVVVVHDGVQVGGYPLMRENGSNSALALGSAGTPSLKFTGDTNTGIYSPGADQVAISTGGSGRITIDASGNVNIDSNTLYVDATNNRVGIGTTPSTLLHIQSTDPAFRFKRSDAGTDAYGELTTDVSGLVTMKCDPANAAAGSGFRITVDNSEALRITSTGALNFVGAGTAGSTQAVSFNGSAPVNSLVIDSSGRLGVGTSSPTAPLHVVSTSAGYTTTMLAIGEQSASTGRQLFLGMHTTDGKGYIQSVHWGTAYKELLLNPNGGNVGIGTSSPGTKTHIYDASNVGLKVESGGANFTEFNLTNTSASYTIGIRPDVSNALVIRDANATANRVAIDSSGRVGIGTTTPVSILDVTVGGSGARKFVANYDDSIITIKGSNDFSNPETLRLVADNLRFSTGTSGSGTERARITSSGQLLVGTSSSPSLTDGQYSKLHVIANTNTASGEGIINIGRGQAASSAFAPGTGLGNLFFTDSAGAVHAAVGAATDGTTGAGDYPGRLVFSTTADGASSPTERARITNNGFLRVSNTGSYPNGGALHEIVNNQAEWVVQFTNSNASPKGLYVPYSAAAPNGTGNEFIYCSDTAALRFSVRSNGGIANYSANNANLSDRNAKKDITPAAGTWNCIKEWEIVNYRYKEQPDDADLNLGVIAQQVAESCPEVITVFEEAKDDQPEKLGVKEQQMYWMAIKALQEAQVRIEALEAEVAALKAS